MPEMPRVPLPLPRTMLESAALLDSDSGSGSGARAPAPHPFLLRLATRLLTKADRSATDRGARLKLDRNAAPELYDHVDVESLRRLELLLDEWCATGWVRLLLARPKDFTGWVDRNPQLELLDFDALALWAGFQRRADQWNQQLLVHLIEHWAPATGTEKQALMDYLLRSPVSALAEMSTADALRSLSALQTLCASGATMPLREASALVFQGRSKVLDKRDELLRLLGAATRQFHEAPIQLLVDIPAGFDEALFVENLVTFEQMADQRRPAWSHTLLVYAAGFKGSAKRLRTRQTCRLYVRPSHGDVVAFDPSIGQGLAGVSAWLFDQALLPVHFFGDLDFAGMQILASLREVFPHAQAWRPGYHDLAVRLAAGGGHPPETASKERQADPTATGCGYADGVLLPLMRRVMRFVDQEAFGSGAQA